MGGTTAGARNVISANDAMGVAIVGPSASDNRILGNYIGTDGNGGTFRQNTLLGNKANGVILDDAPRNTIGGTEPGAGNVISNNALEGILIQGPDAEGNVIQGNRIGTDATGMIRVGNDHDGVETNSPHTTVGGSAAGAPNLISGNGANGVRIGGPAAMGNQVLGNYIGTDVSGTHSLGNTANGVEVNSAPNNTIGAGNVISANRDGVLLSGPAATGNQVLGNYIGTDVTGTRALGNGSDGVRIFSAANNEIGGTAAGAGNIIAHNITAVFIASGVRNPILSNRIFENFFGIDLGPLGPTPNTPGPHNDGANLLQNFPDLTSVTTKGGTTTINGTLNSTPNAIFTLQFFADKKDPTGYGQGRTILGQMAVTTDSAGNVAFTFTSPNPLPLEEQYVSATATDPSGNTSEFSRAITEIIFEVTNANDDGDGSLRQAIRNANAVGGETIKFAIPGPGPYIIDVGATTHIPLPDLSVPNVTIDGTTQPGFQSKPIIVLYGKDAGPDANGLTINGGNTTVKGLVIDGFGGNGIAMNTYGYNVIQGNFIGTDATGTSIILRNQGFGVLISNSPNDTIGGTTAESRNVISGNGASGISIGFSGSRGIQVFGNFIGTDASGTAALGNASNGIEVIQGANAVIGGATPGAGNLISGNQGNGVDISASNNVVQGNLIGTDVAGTIALANALAGLAISASNNTIGGTTPAARNVISGNSRTDGNGVGVQILGAKATGNLIEGNFIGLDASSTRSLRNDTGVLINSAAGNTIGGAAPGAGNVISSYVPSDNSTNIGVGVEITGLGATNNLVEGNLIGTDASGTRTLVADQAGVGILITNTPGSNTIGGAIATARNIIAGFKIGIEIYAPQSPFNPMARAL